MRRVRFDHPRQTKTWRRGHAGLFPKEPIQRGNAVAGNIDAPPTCGRAPHARSFRKGVNHVQELLITVRAFVADKLAKLAGEEKGQTMAEYAVVLAVITLGIVVALVALSGGISNALDNVRSHLP
jgi:Flp pilus assembly pilin Flp